MRYYLLFTIVALALVGCASTQESKLQNTETSTPVMIHTNSHGLLTETLSSTALPATTQIPPSLTPTAFPRSKTPKPTPSSTFTPTAFDPQKVVTRTPAPSAQCPSTTPVVDPNVDFFGFSLADGFNDNIFPAEKNTLDFLNKYGLDALVTGLKQAGKDQAEQWAFGAGQWVQLDLTNDDRPEFAFVTIDVYVMGCSEGQYQTLLKIHPEDWLFGNSTTIVTTDDLNLDGVPEFGVLRHGGWYAEVFIYEWNGKRFEPLTQGTGTSGTVFDYVSMDGGVDHGPTQFDIQDVDDNGIAELVFQGGIPTNFDRFYYGPWRVKTETYAWNGQRYVWVDEDYTAPEYRFQAVQDGDRAALAGDYETALTLYQEAIFSDKLDWWSPARSAYTIEKNNAEFQGSPTPTSPPLNPDEYYQLAAYARYRIMLLHLLQAGIPEAQIVYETLKEKFPIGNAGHPYAEMAELFWTEYQSLPDMAKACAKAIAFAADHPAILMPLGSDYHGDQSWRYQPPDICPFK